MRAAPVAVVVVLAALASGCKNELTYAPPGAGLDCDAVGSLCSHGFTGVGDEGPSLGAALAFPFAMDVAPDGSILVADRANNRLRRIDPSGDVTTIAGTGEEEYAIQLGLPAVDTHVPSPIGIAATDDGWVFWTDRSTCAIYGIDPDTGLAQLVAGDRCGGTGVSGPPLTVGFDFGDCEPLRAVGNDLLISDFDGYFIKYWNRGSAPVTVVGITVQPGEITIVAGNGNSVITDNVGATTTGTPWACDALLAPDGSIYFANFFAPAVRRIEPTGTIRRFAGTYASGFSSTPVAASAGAVTAPHGLALDPDAELLFIAEDQDRMRAINLTAAPVSWVGTVVSAGTITVVGGWDVTVFADRHLVVDSGHTLTQQLTKVRSPVFDAQGNLLLADPINGLVRSIDGTTGVDRVVSGYADGRSRDFYMLRPSGLARESDGSLYVSGHAPYLWRIDPDGTRSVFAGNGEETHGGDGEDRLAASLWPSGIAIDPVTGAVLVSDLRNRRIRSIDGPTGVMGTAAGAGNCCYGGDDAPAVSAGMNQPAGIAFDPAGNLYIADTERIRFVNRGVTNVTLCNAKEVAPGNITVLAGGGGYGYGGDGEDPLTAKFRFNDESTYPTGLAVADGVLYIADTLNHRIRALDLTTCALRTVIGSGFDSEDAVGRPVGLAVHDGRLYWTQVTGSYVRRMTLPNGPVETLAGNGRIGYSGEGIAAKDSALNTPYGIVVTPDGVVYVADGSHRVRRIRP